MWTRRELKDQAKAVMKRSYWKMFAITLVATLLIGLFSSRVDHGTSYTYAYNVGDMEASFSFHGLLDLLPFHGVWVVGTLSFIILLSVIVSICYSVFIANAISYGENRFYLENAKHSDVPFMTLFSAFQNGYFNIVKILLIKDIKQFLWTLLFIIPGIIKSYEYKMIPYILAENPEISTEEAFARSKQLTSGQKGDMFVLDLSFLGWMILGTVLFGLGVYFVYPYVNATYAELYLTLTDQKMEDDYFG